MIGWEALGKLFLDSSTKNNTSSNISLIPASRLQDLVGQVYNIDRNEQAENYRRLGEGVLPDPRVT